MFNTIQGALAMISFPVDSPEEAIPRTPPLSPNDRVLYDKIVADLLRIYDRSTEKQKLGVNPSLTSHLPKYNIIFRQTKSWKVVEDLLQKITSTDPKIQEWASEWTNRIHAMRVLQQTLFKHEEALKAMRIRNPESIKLEKNLKKHKAAITSLLNQGKRSIELIDRSITQDNQCLNVINYIRTYWIHLRVFSQWSAVSLDEEKIVVQVQAPKDPRASIQEIPYDALVNDSTKAIFVIEEVINSTPNESILEEKQTKKRTRLREVKIAQQYLAPSSSSSSSQSHSIGIHIKEYVFDCDFAQSIEANSLKTRLKNTSITSLALGRVVKLAISQVNRIRTGESNDRAAVLEIPNQPLKHSLHWILNVLAGRD